MFSPLFGRVFVALGLVGAVYANPVHPRLFVGPSDVSAIRARAQSAELAPVVQAIQWMTQSTNGVSNDPFSYDFHKQFGNYAILYLATGNATFAAQARDETLYHISKTEWWANDSYRSLRRGALSRGAAISYDFCYDAWSGQTVPASVTWRGETVQVPPQYVGLDLNTAVSQALKANVQSLIRSGGGDWPGNDKTGNNWFAVRYGGALIGLLASDETGMDTEYTTALTQLRAYLRDNLSTNPSARGWNPEGYGYSFYPSQFTFPALLALSRNRNVNLQSEVPAIRYALPVLYSGLMSLQTNPGTFIGLHPDFTDDNPQWFGEGAANLAFAFAPDEMKPALKWMYRRSFGDLGDNKWDSMSVGGLYALLYYPVDVPEQNPANVPSFSRNWEDPVSGFFSTRKAFNGSEDILTQFHTKSRQNIGGHNGPDGLTFRIFGLGVPWAVGSGRTVDGAGQSTIYASDPLGGVGYQGVVGTVPNYYMRPGGGGYWVGRNQPFSDTGVRNWTRRFIVDYGVETGTEAFFVVSDTSDSGRYWRFNTPEFNTITTSGNQFTVTNTLTGHRLIGTVLHPANPVFRTGDFTRGSAYNFRGSDFLKNNWVDFTSADGSFLVTFALVRSGNTAPIPQLTGTPGNGVVQLGSRAYTISGDEIQVTGWERPQVVITSPTADAALTGGPQQINIHGTVTSPAGTPIRSVEVFLNGSKLGDANLQGSSWSLASGTMPRGTHEIRARATDDNAEWSEKIIRISVNQTVPPSISISAPAAGSSLPADQPFVLRGSTSDPEGSTPSVQVFSGTTLLGTAPVTAGRWIYTVPASAFTVGRRVFSARATDAAGDSRETAPVELRASRLYSNVPIYGDLAYWTPFPNENRVSLATHDGDVRWFVESSLGYTKRNADMYVADTSFDGDFRLTFRAKLVSGLLRVWFGNLVYMAFGTASNPGSMQYVGWGDKPIGTWQQPLFLNNTAWHDIEISRIGQVITIKRNGTNYISMRLNDDGTCTLTPDIVTEDLTFGWRDKYQWYKGYWSGGAIGIGAPFADGTSFYMDDFNVEVLSGNQPPALAITQPSAQLQSPAGQAVTISGTASDPENGPVSIHLFAGSEQIGTGIPVTNGTWSFDWTPPLQSVYGISAQAVDSRNNTARSNSVTVVVGSGNSQPTIQLTRPVDGAGVSVNADTTLSADASDADGAIVSVRFFINDVLAATDTTAPYSHTWRPTVTGNYTVRAEAVDDMNATATTPNVAVVVTPANTLPTATLTNPGDLSRINLGASTTFSANASDSGGTIARVDFYDNGVLVGSDNTSPYQITYTPAAAGTRTLMAVAIDDLGGAGYSATRTLFVTSASNQAPATAITSPANGSTLIAPLSSILLTANAGDADGSIHRVQFFAGTTLLGEDRTAPYEFTWTNVAAGTYSLTARATDNEGTQTTSAPVSVTLAYTPGTEAAASPVADAYVADGVNTNFGTLATLRTQDKTWSYLRFPVAIPTGAVLRAARLRVVPTSDRDRHELFFQPDDTWGETTVTGTNEPSKGTAIVTGFSVRANAAVEIDVTQSARQEVAGDGVLSLTLGAAGNQFSGTDYHSREATTVANRPQLVLTYNILPTLTLNAPANPVAGVPATISASVSDSDGTVASVAFFVDGTAVGDPVTSAPYSVSWTAPAAGTYAITAAATDNLGDTREVTTNVTVQSGQPAAATGLAAQPISSSQMALSWTGPGGSPTGFRADYRVSGQSTWTSGPEFTANTTSGTVSGLNPETTYEFVLITFAQGGSSNPSNMASATTPAEPFADWIDRHPVGNLTGAGDDADGDGVPNLIEFALGGEPANAGNVPASPTPTLAEVGNERHLALSFEPARTEGLRFVVEASDDLSGWTEEFVLTGVVAGEVFTFTDDVVVNEATSRRRFLRLRIEELP